MRDSSPPTVVGIVESLGVAARSLLLRGVDGFGNRPLAVFAPQPIGIVPDEAEPVGGIEVAALHLLLDGAEPPELRIFIKLPLGGLADCETLLLAETADPSHVFCAQLSHVILLRLWCARHDNISKNL